MMRRIADLNLRNMIAVIVLAASGATLGCSSDPPPLPELTPAAASTLISQKWSNEELNHFRVVFHSDTLIECGVKNELWKLTEMTDRTGYAWTAAYQLTERGKKVIAAIDLKESGRGHEVVLRGPYRCELTSITDGAVPNNKRVGFRWQIDWDKAPEDLKACLPQFELSGSELALFEISDPTQNWRFTSYLRPEDAPVASSGSVVDKLK